MFRFDQLVKASMTVREVRQRFPQTAEVFEKLGFRATCDDCAIEVAARRGGLVPADVVNQLNWAVFGPESENSHRPTE